MMMATPGSDQYERSSVLLVEDNMTDVHAVLRRFHGSRLGIRHVRTGNAALELIANERFRAVLVDQRLPDMSGTDVCRKMRADGLDVPIFIMSAGTDDALGEACQGAGATAYLVKEIAFPSLVRLLEQHVQSA